MSESTLLRTNISLDTLGGDVWTWEKRITGTCPGLPPNATIAVSVNGASIPAQREGDRFEAIARLIPGANEVRAIATLADGRNIASDPATHMLRLTPRPISRIDIRIENGNVVLDGTASGSSDHDGSPIVEYRWTPPPHTPSDPGETGTPDDQSTRRDARITLPAPETDGEYAVALEVTDASGRCDTSRARFVVENGTARAVDPVSERAAWVEGAVVYGMVVRNFTSEGFRGVTSRLGELADLGITAIWFAPITRTFPGDFGYAVTDYFDVRPELGTLDDFRELVGEAHRHGIRILMDFVPNHSSDQHPYFEHAQAHGPASPYWDWYDRDQDGAPTHYFQWEHLPNLNFDNPEVRQFMTEAFAFWMRECDVDGFRVDVAWGIRERRPDWWLEWSAELNRIKPDSLLIAEASARDPFYVHNGFDAAYDWTDQLGVWAWTEVFAGNEPMSTAMPRALTNSGQGYDPASLVFRFLNNNDTGERVITTRGEGFYRAAMAMLMTLPGIPCVYTGDEAGAEYHPYRMDSEIAWDDPSALRPFVRRLIELRRENRSLSIRSWTLLDVEPSSSMFGYLREAEGEAPIAVLLNFSDDDLDANMSVPTAMAGEPVTDLWSGERIASDTAALTISMPSWGVRMLKPLRGSE